jgi:peptidoglycan/xylan/chitin deacetylase (PgdA/CDA1 family)
MKNLKEKLLNLFYLTGSNLLSGPSIFGDRGIILMYHRILPDDICSKESASLAVSTTQFNEQMKFISSNFRCLHINELEAALKKNEFFVVVTFDDGYRDNLEHALPILNKYGVPATVYITTRFINEDRKMWWYEIPEILMKGGHRQIQWRNALLSLEASSDTEIITTYKRLKNTIVRLSYLEQEALMDALRNGERAISFDDLVLTEDQISRLSQSPLITIGAHTHNHPVLKNESVETVKKEMKNSVKLLSDCIGKKVEHFAYPYGHHLHAQEREYSLAKEFGFKTAVTTIGHPLLVDTNLFALPRMAITKRNTLPHFKSKLYGWNYLLGDFQA